MTLRTFLALPLKAAAVRRLADYADTLCGLDIDGRVHWSDSNSYHLTLCFLGQISLEQVASLEQKIQVALQEQCSFQVHLHRIDYLQVNPQLTVLAALSELSSELLQLQQRLAEVVSAAGIVLQSGAFQPHVTLGRLAADSVFDSLEIAPSLDQSSLADAVVLYQSIPAGAGSIYTPLFAIGLSSEMGHQSESAVIGDR